MTEWASQFEGEHGVTELVGLAVDSKGDVALAGHVLDTDGVRVDGRKDAIVMKLASEDGKTLWTRKLGSPGSHDWSSAVATDATGNFFVAGQTDGYMFSPSTVTGQDMWVAKLEGDRGEVMWGFQTGSQGKEVASALAVDPNTGDVLVCGSTTGGLFQRQNSAPSNASGDDVARQPAAAAGGVAEAYCAKLAAADGKVVWGSRLKGGSSDGLLAVAVDPESGDIFAAGFTTDTVEMRGNDFLAVRLDGSNGREKWRASGGGGWADPRSGGAYLQDSLSAIAADGFGNVVVAGNSEGALFVSTADGHDTDAFVAKLNGTTGNVVWGWQGSSSGNGYANAVAVDDTGDVYACGSAAPGLFARREGYMDGHGKGGLGSKDSEGRHDEDFGRTSEEVDMFLAKLDGRSGALVWGEQFGSAADDHAVGLVLGPSKSEHYLTEAAQGGGVPEAGESELGQGGGAGEGGNSPLYLTGWTRGALYSDVPARWQDGWAVKLSNPPPKTLGITGRGAFDPGSGVPTDPLSTAGGGTGVAQQSASDAARGAFTIGFVGSAIGVVVIVSAALCLLFKRTSYVGGALSAWKYETNKSVLGGLRRRHRMSASDGSGMSGGPNGSAGMSGSGGSVHHGSAHDRDSVELTLLSCEGGDSGGVSSPLAYSRHGGGCGGVGSSSAMGAGGALGAGGEAFGTGSAGGSAGGVGSGGRREASKSSPTGLRPPTFYL